MRTSIKTFPFVILGFLLFSPLSAAPEKPRVAVLDFEFEGGASEVEASGIAEEIRKVFVSSEKYTVIDRTLTDNIMTEWAIQPSGLTAEERAVKVGRLYNVQVVVTGKLLKFPDGGWQISGVMLDAQTGITSRAETIHYKGDYFSLLVQKVPILALNLAGIKQPATFKPTQPAPRHEAESRVARGPYRDPTTGMEFVWINGGTFDMGCGPWNRGDCEDEEKPGRQVRVDSYWMGKHEVTVSEFLQFARETNGNFPEWLDDASQYHFEKGNDDHYRKLGIALTQGNYPITGVSWHDAVAFTHWLSRKSGISYRLPSEAEWEFACRGGGKRVKYAWGDGDPYINGQKAANIPDRTMKQIIPNYDIWEGYDDGYAYTAPVGSFAPNTLGLFDMTGNVWEWALDVFDKQAYWKADTDNPIFEGASGSRVQRGGSWDDPSQDLRCTHRDDGQSSERDYNLGFRLVRTR